MIWLKLAKSVPLFLRFIGNTSKRWNKIAIFIKIRNPDFIYKVVPKIVNLKIYDMCKIDFGL